MAEYDQFDLQFHNDTSKRKRKKQIINDLKKQVCQICNSHHAFYANCQV